MDRRDVNFCAIGVAAGRGLRFGQPKQLIELAGRPMIGWSLATFGAMPELEDLVIATEPEHVERMAALAAEYAPRLSSIVVRGGATRQQSARCALEAVPSRCDAAFIHDGARPLVLARDVRAGMALTRPGEGSLIAAPVVDTIKVVEPGTTNVVSTLDRSSLWSAQTPQFGALQDLRRAHEEARVSGFEATDDAMLLERIGVSVHVVAPSAENFKVTLAGDRDLASVILRERSRDTAGQRAGAGA
jgi:2-C-methyl-D-erythritol 4-phosphate cytidylyltransferase